MKIQKKLNTLNRLTHASTTAATSTPYTRHYTYNSLGNIITASTSAASVSTYVYAGNTGSNYANPHAVTSNSPTSKIPLVFNTSHKRLS